MATAHDQANRQDMNNAADANAKAAFLQKYGKGRRGLSRIL
jgi:hypothetical protein